MPELNPTIQSSPVDKKIAIVLPAYEPDTVMVPFVRSMQDFLSEDLSLLVINDGSGKAHCSAIFEEISAMPHCTVLHHEVNRGKGAALKTAFSFLLEKYKDSPGFAGCVTADCDNQHSVSDIMQAVKLLRNSTDTLILGCRNFQQDDVPWKSRVGNTLTRFIFRNLLRLPISDTQTGLRGIPVKLMEKSLELESNRFEMETEMLLLTSKCRCAIREYPIATLYFDRNSGTHFHPVKDALKIYAVIFKFFFGMFFRFLLSALSSAALDIGLFSLLFYKVLPAGNEIEIAGRGFDSRILPACVIARITSSLWNFFINRTLVFKSRASGKFTLTLEMGKYYLLALFILAASWLLTDACRKILPEAYLAAAKLLIDSMLFIISYSIQRLIVFNKRS